MDKDGLTVVCAWCDCTVREGGSIVSHGICADCATGFISRMSIDYLRMIADADGMVSLFSGHRLDINALGG
jgi:hypothetical protein